MKEFKRSIHIESLEKVRGEHIDITLGNHTAQNDTEGKYRRMIERPDGPNPFIDISSTDTFERETASP